MQLEFTLLPVPKLLLPVQSLLIPGHLLPSRDGSIPLAHMVCQKYTETNTVTYKQQVDLHLPNIRAQHG
jgi:hypothetical protein